jgi:hypothetical protein
METPNLEIEDDVIATSQGYGRPTARRYPQEVLLVSTTLEF